jgi:TolA-binding protein
MGYIAFMRNDYDDAERYLARIVSKSDYADHATYYRSYMAYTRGEYDVARNGFSSLQQSALYRDLMPYYIMQIDFRSGDYRAVVNSGDALIENTTAEQALQIRRMMAESWFQLEDYTSTVNYINAYRSAGGEMGRLENYILGYSLHRQTLYEDAIGALREVCGADDMLTQNASYHLADCYLRTGDKTNAMHSFAMASTATYDTAIAEDALFNYGKLQYELGGGRFNEAINVLTRYIESYPQSHRRDEAHKLLIAAYYNSHNYGEAYEAIKSLPSPDGDALLALQKIAYFNGLEAYSQGRLEDAERSLGESMSVSSNAKYSALASFWLGEIAYAKGNSGVALQRYRNFVARAPKSGEEYAMAHYNMGYCYFNEKNMPQAGEAFDKFLGARARRDDYRADALNRRGDVHYASREFDDAVACYDQAININSTHRYYAEYQRAVTLGVQNKAQEKITSLQRIVSADRGDYVDAATYELGRTYIAQEKYQDGVKILEDFVAHYPNSQYHSQALSDLGLAYMNLGDKQKALAFYDQVVKSAPKSAQSKSALQGIKEIYVAEGNADGYFDYAQNMGLESNVSQLTRDSMAYISAQKLYLENKMEAATASLSSYLKNYPQGYYRNDALFYLSDCYVRAGNEAEAIVSLSELAEQGQTQYSERVLDKLSSMCYKSERWAEAAKAYRSLYDVTSDAKLKKSSASGYVASTLKYADDEALLKMADDAEKMTVMTDVARRKARYAKASVLLRQQKQEEALKVFKTLATEAKSAEGAEAHYRLIEAEFNAKQYDKAEKMVYDFSDTKTPQNYWLAKSFILLGDIYLSKGDGFQARATYQSVVDGYSPADDGIIELAKSKISKMN